jgi:uroporphyrin-III C-methyltransferase/precorrin-2 dehydrogenase/sirohydrochlorin ferrochelatase
VAAAKVPALLAAGARVTVIAPWVSPEIDRARVEVIERAFEPADLDGAWFVTAAATPAVNRQVRDAAEPRGLFVNAVDDPANATAYLGGTLARGGVTVAFSTSGQAPALAGLLREAFDDLLPDDLDVWARRAHELRNQQRRAGVPMGARRPQLLDALNKLYDTRERHSAGRL